MPDNKNNLYLYEAIELRAEYDARMKTLKSILPEARQNRSRLSFGRDDEIKYRLAESVDLDKIQEALAKLEIKRRKLNNAIQRANFDNTIAVDGQEMSLTEALELRKSVNEKLGEASEKLKDAAYERVIYKEDRDIVETPETDFNKAYEALEKQRRLFRSLNRQLRDASFRIVVDFKDEA